MINSRRGRSPHGCVRPRPRPLDRPRNWSRRSKLIAGTVGAAMAGGVALAASSWLVGLSTGSTGQTQAGGVSNISIVPVANAGTNLLFPGGTGDVTAKIVNPNAFPVTVTGVDLPSATTYATGFGDASLTTPQSGCLAATSLVSWSYATAASGSVHTLAAPITVAANGNTTITFTNAASMALAAPAACESTFFAMPAFTGVVASVGSGAATTASTDSWAS